jgi:single-stranded-DNA-specific exonuclease
LTDADRHAPDAGDRRDPATGKFRRALAEFGSGPVRVLGHNDADGLAASSILARGLARQGRPTEVRILKRGETAWSPDIRIELAGKAPGGLIVTDLGVRSGTILADVPTVFIDHHVPQGSPESATVLSGFGMDPVPTSSLLAFRCVSARANVDDLLWLAAVGLVGDMAETSGFAEMAVARRRWGINLLRKIASLLNQPRRSASGDPTPALALLMKCREPQELLSGEHSETAALLAAREEVRAELDAARRIAPRVAGDVALIRFASPCQVHPLVAQAWTGRLRDRIVLAANTGFRPDWVHFAARAARDVDLVAFLAAHAPPGADENYGGGHRKASGGALRPADWNAFVRSLGFGAEMEVTA